MYDSNIDWILAIVSALAGIGIGALGYHLLNANVARNQKTRQRLAETELELSQVKDGLNDHFARAADLITGLQRQSQELEKQLALAAERLCDNAPLKQHLGDKEPNHADEASLSAPRDYADGNRGTLAEDFGLRRDEAADSSEASQPPRY